MNRRILNAIFFASFFSLGCSGNFTNSFEESRLICGDGFKDGASYVQVIDFEKGSSSDLVAIDKNISVTANGCVEIPKEGKFFLTNIDRSAGAWVTPQSSGMIYLKSMETHSIPPSCSSIIHADGSGFSLEFPTEQITSTELQYLSLKLRDKKSREILINWPLKQLQSSMSFGFDPFITLQTGEYDLLAEVEDKITGAVSFSSCELRYDISSLFVNVAEKIQSKIKIGDEDVYIVNPGYAVNFYVQGEFRDFEIEYCLYQFEFQNSSNEICRNPLRFIESNSEKLDNGSWKLYFRSRRNSFVSEWQSVALLVSKTCRGEIVSRNPSSEGKGCTTILGDLTLKNVQEKDILALESVVQISGLLSLDQFSGGTIEFFPNLKTIYGDLKISEYGNHSLIGFNSLTDLFGSVSFSNSDHLEDLKVFQSLHSIQGALTFISTEHLKYIAPLGGLKSLSNLILRRTGLADLLFISNVSSIFGVQLYENDGLVDLEGFPKVENIGELVIGDARNFRSFKGFSGALSPFNLKLTNLPQLSSLETLDATKLSALSIQGCIKLESLSGQKGPIFIGGVLSVAGDVGFESFSELHFSQVISSLSIINSNLVSLKGFSQIKRIIGKIEIKGNKLLKDLGDLNPTNIGSISLEDNPKLVNIDILNLALKR